MKKLERHHTIFLRGTTEEHLLEVRVAASNSSQPVFTGAKWLTVSSYQQHGVYEPKEVLVSSPAFSATDLLRNHGRD
eukprot:4020458-Pyramimonas_sp.AAC.1